MSRRNGRRSSSSAKNPDSLPKPRSRGLRIAVLVSLCAALVFAIAGYIGYGFSLAAALAGAVMGGLLGVIAAPALAPKAFRFPVLWQMAAAVAGGLLVTAVLGAGVEGYLLAIIGGIVVGYLAPLWIRHVTLP